MLFIDIIPTKMYFCKGRENSPGNWSGSFFGPSCLDCILLLFSSELSNLGKVKFPGLFATNIIGEGTGSWHWGHLRPSQKISQHVFSYNSRVPVPGKDMCSWGVFSILMVLRTWSQVDQLTTGNFYQREVHFVWVRSYIKHPVRSWCIFSELVFMQIFPSYWPWQDRYLYGSNNPIFPPEQSQ